MTAHHQPFVSSSSFLMVRARIDRSVYAQFTSWYYRTLRPHMLAIPGITSSHSVVPPRGEAELSPWLRVYQFSRDSEIQEALDSPQAHQARDDWAEWDDHVHDLTIEVYTPLLSAPLLHHWN